MEGGRTVPQRKAYNMLSHTSGVVTSMSDDAHPDARNRPAEDGLDEDQRLALETIEVYETEDGIVLYDALNPLAWLQTTAPLTLKEQV